MKTKMTRRIVLVIGLSALLTGPALAAFGDAVAPSSLSGNSVPGSALPPGTYPSSPADGDKKADTAPKEKAATSGASGKQQATPKKPKKAKPRSDS
ncbi:hypothetical protein HX787_00275 [Pseudomonas tolaasii]|uniref:Uncharacterized protein n=2 Tax=Pseudomonas tolaasii TaxID=29442 RepID=A0A7Y8AJF6_PSETO|nr:hypothetical protein [Pseudomonas tolaasii]ARB27597.1 hypothetical protein B5P22_10040 [Pseudomonas tolaasii]KAB0467875.1 hypothetical protein F7R12_24495 [Pseudomonas tolaasii]MBW1247322.1 hypothetical protein [Pseudomonas tolaasii]MBW4791876.1 hypothetical protein [Pseudomonas tolaasii]MBY8943714.1 hypothetical protein [Pseudomonas tolaasii]